MANSEFQKANYTAIQITKELHNKLKGLALSKNLTMIQLIKKVLNKYANCKS
jgi:hypothetical protein